MGQVKNHAGIYQNALKQTVTHDGQASYSVECDGKVRIVTEIGKYNDFGFTCSCHWGESRPEDDRRSACKHVVAVVLYMMDCRGILPLSSQGEPSEVFQSLFIGDNTWIVVAGISVAMPDVELVYKGDVEVTTKAENKPIDYEQILYDLDNNLPLA